MLSSLAVFWLAAPGVLAEPPHRHPLVFLEVINPIVSEDGAQGSFRVRRTGPVDSRLVIRMFQQGQPVQASSPISVPQFVVIPPGQTEVTYTLRAFDSAFAEGTRILTLSLELPTSPTNAFRLAPPHSAQFTILDSKVRELIFPTIGVEVLTPFLDRQDPGPALFRITRRGLLGGDLDVPYRIASAGAWGVDATTSGPSSFRAPTRNIPIAQPGIDYLPTAGIAHFASGAESVLVSVTLLPNRDPATDKALALGIVSDARYFDDRGGPKAAILLDAESTPAVTFRVNSATAFESDGPPGEIEIFRTGTTSKPIDVRLAFQGSAVEGADYQPIPRVVTIPVGARSTRLQIHATPDSTPDPDRDLLIGIEPHPDYSAAELPSAMIAIVDNPAYPYNIPPWIFDFSAALPGTSHLRTQDPDGHVERVEFLLNGTVVAVDSSPPYDWIRPWARAGAYTLAARVTDNHGATTISQTLSLAVAEDVPPIYTLALSTDFTSLSEPAVAPPALPTHATIVIRRIGELSWPLEIPLQTGGTATQGIDYPALPSALLFAEEQSTLQIPVQALPDETIEALEHLVLRIKPGPNYSVAPPTSITLTLHDAIESEPDAPTHLRPRVVQVRLHSSGSSIITVLAAAETFFRLDRSQDLLQWQTLGIFRNPSPVFEFVDHTATTSPTAFYRAIPEPPTAMRQ